VLQRIRDLPDQGLYGVIGVMAVIALYVIGFVIKNSKNVSVDFVLFSAGVPLITLMVVMLLLGALLGVALTLILARRRAPSPTVPPTVHVTTPPPASEAPVSSASRSPGAPRPHRAGRRPRRPIPW
jgi:uncharacterized integral membrane protein